MEILNANNIVALDTTARSVVSHLVTSDSKKDGQMIKTTTKYQPHLFIYELDLKALVPQRGREKERDRQTHRDI